MTNKDIAELTTQILTAASNNENLKWNVESICVVYEELFKTIKKMDKEEN